MIIDFSGFVSIDADKVVFIHSSETHTISGQEWLSLDDDSRKNYFVDNVLELLNTCKEEEMEFETAAVDTNLILDECN